MTCNCCQHSDGSWTICPECKAVLDLNEDQEDRELLDMYWEAGASLRKELGNNLIPKGLVLEPIELENDIPKKSDRHNSGKTQTREIYPKFLMGIGEVLTKSRDKYDHYNWCKATKISTPYESAMRHLMEFQSGADLDAESGKHHLLHVATNIMFMYYHMMENPDYADDRFFKKDKK